MAAFGSGITLGFLGIGAMGAPMARRLLAAGHAVHVFDIRPGAAALLGHGAFEANSPRMLANRADLVISCLPTEAATREAVLGANGLIQGERMRHYVHAGTCRPAFLEELAASLAQRGVGTLDAPITGGVPRAEVGRLTTIVAGSQELVEQARPYLSCYASHIVQASARVGDAQRLKLFNNLLSASNLAFASEAFVLVRKAGLDPEQALDAINQSSGQNSATLHKLPAEVLTRRFQFGGAIGLMLKDLEAAAAEAQRLGARTPMSDAVRESFRRAIASGKPEDDVTTLILPMERAAGLEPVPETRATTEYLPTNTGPEDKNAQ